MFWYLLLAAFPVMILPVVNTFYKTTIDKSEKAKKVYFFWCGLAMFLMIALRHNSVGSADSYNYYSNWGYLRSLSLEAAIEYIPGHIMESGYLYTVWALAKFFESPQFLFVFSGLFFSISICRFVYKNSKEPAISLVMFVCLGLYTFMVQGLRQAIAMGICLFAIEYCKQKKPWQFFILIYVATLYHSSAIAFIPVYFLGRIKLNSMTYFGTFTVGAVIMVMSDYLIDIANKWFQSDYYETVDSGGFIAVAIYVIIIVMAFLFQKEYADKQNYNLFFLLTFYGAVFYIMRYFGASAAGRVSWYYMFGQMILLPNIVASMEKRTREVATYGVVGLSILLFAYRLHDSNLIPFKFFWQ